MSQSAVDVCNSALQKVGAASIVNLSDNSREARACNLAYDSNRRDELRKHRWKFAIKRATLAPDAVGPNTPDFMYQFTLPSDCLRILLPNDNSLDWSLEGRKILTNSAVSPFNSGGQSANIVYVPSGGLVGTITQTTAPTTALYLRYMADITDCTQWDSSFYNLIAISLAIDICEQLTNSSGKRAALNNEYREATGEARMNDAFESIPADAPDDTWWTVRF